MKNKRKIYIEEIRGFFEKNGFKLKDGNFFIKTTSDFEYGIVFTFTKWSDGFYMKPNLYLHYLPVDEIFKNATGFSNGFIYCEAGLIFGNSDFEITDNHAEILHRIENNNEIKNSRNQIYELYHKKIVPYFERFSHLNYLDEVFNSNPLRFTCSNYKNFNRYSVALILAKLNKRNDYNELLEIYENEIQKSSNRKIQDRFFEVKEYLESEK